MEINCKQDFLDFTKDLYLHTKRNTRHLEALYQKLSDDLPADEVDFINFVAELSKVCDDYSHIFNH